MAYDWFFFGIIRALINVGGVGPGGNLAAAAVALNFLSNICISVAAGCSCCCGQLGPLPGVGNSRTSCCCPERNPDMGPEGVPASGLKVAVPDNKGGVVVYPGPEGVPASGLKVAVLDNKGGAVV